jgi:hypothetical protein
MAFTEDPTLYLADFGVSCSAGAVSGVGILDQDSEMALGGDVVFIPYMLTAEASKFGGLEYGDSITVDGVGYIVEHKPMLTDDGTFCRVPLAITTTPASVNDSDNSTAFQIVME